MSHRMLVLLAVCVLALGCAGTPTSFTDGSSERRAKAEADQQVADTFRNANASDAARQAQARADRSRAEADAKPSSFLDWLADVLFYSWMNALPDPTKRK